jgi:cytochrome c
MRAFRVSWIAAGLLALVSSSPSSAQQAAAPADGAQLFELVCAMCHSVAPPAKAAPPMSHAAAYYIRRHREPGAALAALVAYLKAPTAETSAMPAHVIERFGLMPPQAHLAEAQLQAVARYALTLADTVHVSADHVHRPPQRQR